MAADPAEPVEQQPELVEGVESEAEPVEGEAAEPKPTTEATAADSDTEVEPPPVDETEAEVEDANTKFVAELKSIDADTTKIQNLIESGEYDGYTHGAEGMKLLLRQNAALAKIISDLQNTTGEFSRVTAESKWLAEFETKTGLPATQGKKLADDIRATFKIKGYKGAVLDALTKERLNERVAALKKAKAAPAATTRNVEKVPDVVPVRGKAPGKTRAMSAYERLAAGGYK